MVPINDGLGIIYDNLKYYIWVLGWLPCGDVAFINVYGPNDTRDQCKV